MIKHISRRLAALAAALVLSVGCDSSSVDDAIDIIEGIPRKTIDQSKMGVNGFFNDPRFGSIDAQYSDIRNTLGLRFVRVLFDWNDAVQSSPGSAINFSFYDNIVNSAPGDVDLLVIITGIPSWMNNPGNWINGNPRITFAQRYVRAVVQRYGSNPRIIGWQMWNEPNESSDPQAATLGIQSSPENYVELLAASYGEAKAAAPGKLVLNAATTAINQNFSESLDYNRDMRDAGALDFLDVWAIHYYGKQFENVVRSDGVEDFLNGLGKPIWVTESGEQGVTNQLAYGEQAWPFLIEEIPGIQRIYVYQYAEATPANVTFGLKNPDPGMPVSDLYVWFRDN